MRLAYTYEQSATYVSLRYDLRLRGRELRVRYGGWRWVAGHHGPLIALLAQPRTWCYQGATQAALGLHAIQVKIPSIPSPPAIHNKKP
jgi:hypothetical protein